MGSPVYRTNPLTIHLPTKHVLAHEPANPAPQQANNTPTSPILASDYGLAEYRREKFETEDEREMEELYRKKQQRDLVYKAPETWVRVTFASDVYSFAIIMVEVASRMSATEVCVCMLGMGGGGVWRWGVLGWGLGMAAA